METKKRTFNNLSDFQRWLTTLRRPCVVDDDIIILDETLEASEGVEVMSDSQEASFYKDFK